MIIGALPAVQAESGNHVHKIHIHEDRTDYKINLPEITRYNFTINYCKLEQLQMLWQQIAAHIHALALKSPWSFPNDCCYNKYNYCTMHAVVVFALCQHIITL